MKGLSIEEKVKAYDNIIEKANKMYSENCEACQMCIEELIPELREESEDEKIRKELIEYLVKDVGLYPGENRKEHKWLRWLEKQKAIDVLDEEEREFADNVDSYRKEIDAAYQKGYDEGVKATLEEQSEYTKFRDSIQIGDQVTRNKDGVLVNLSQLKRVAKSVVEPIFRVDNKIQYLKGCGTIMTIEKIENGEYIFKDNMGHVSIEEGNKWYLVEKAPNLDIEIPFGVKDSELIEECIHIPEGYHAFIEGDKIIITKRENPNEWKQDNIEDLTDFENAMMHIGGSFFGECAGLNPNDTSSIKEQANILFEIALEQEWSEEDEKMLNDILMCWEHHCYLDAENVAWIKSLKDRYTWKPSDKQMEALWEIYKGGEEQATLASLYSDLKKLKENKLWKKN